MKFYYDGVGYNCKWKSLASRDSWCSQEPVKITTTIPRSIYIKILLDIKLESENIIQSDPLRNISLRNILRFKVSLFKSETNIYTSFLFHKENKKIGVEKEFWEIEAYLDRASISGESKDIVIAHFEMSIFKKDEMKKSDIRDLLLSEIL